MAQPVEPRPPGARELPPRAESQGLVPQLFTVPFTEPSTGLSTGLSTGPFIESLEPRPLRRLRPLATQVHEGSA